MVTCLALYGFMEIGSPEWSKLALAEDGGGSYIPSAEGRSIANLLPQILPNKRVEKKSVVFYLSIFADIPQFTSHRGFGEVYKIISMSNRRTVSFVLIEILRE